MAHTTPITESQVRHVDEYKVLAAADPNGEVYFNELGSESQARHVDEYKHAAEHEAESF